MRSLATARSDGSHQRPLTSVPSFFSDWMPDGSGLAFDYFDDVGEHVATIRPDGSGFRQLTYGAGIQEVVDLATILNALRSLRPRETASRLAGAGAAPASSTASGSKCRSPAARCPRFTPARRARGHTRW